MHIIYVHMWFPSRPCAIHLNPELCASQKTKCFKKTKLCASDRTGATEAHNFSFGYKVMCIVLLCISEVNAHKLRWQSGPSESCFMCIAKTKWFKKTKLCASHRTGAIDTHNFSFVTKLCELYLCAFQQSMHIYSF